MADGAPVRFEYDPPTVRFGPGATATLDAELARHELQRAVVVCGETVGSTAAVIDPVREGLGDRLIEVFARASADKRVATAAAAADRFDAVNADVVVGLGAGSSLDIAKAATAIHASGIDAHAAATMLAADGTIPLVDAMPLPIVTIPTTLAGAELSHGGGIRAHPDTDPVEEPVSGAVRDPRLMPLLTVYDPALVVETPTSILAGSAMNGFDKGIEALYAPTATPITDATASRGVAKLADALVELGREGRSIAVLERVLEGMWLVQFGAVRPDATTLSIIHAFGHGLTSVGDLQQGIAHAAVVEPVLRFVFERVDGRRDLIATALGVPPADPASTADDIVARIATVRDALGLPRRLRAIDGLAESDLDAVARLTAADRLMANAPAGLDPTTGDLLSVLTRAW